MDTAVLPERQRFDAWAAELAHSAEIGHHPELPARHAASLVSWPASRIVVSRVRCGPQTTRLLPPSRRLTDPETLHLRVCHGGRSQGMSGETPFRTQAGEVHVFDFTRPFSNLSEGSDFTGIFMPREMLGHDPASRGPHAMARAGSPAARMIAAATAALAAAGPGAPAEELGAAVEGFAALIRALLVDRMPPAEARRSIGAVRRAELRQFVECHLADPELSVETVCRAFGASRATVYRDFSEDGGIRRYILARRLERAREDLLSAPAAHGRVSRIAERWGFESASHFSRAFRSNYGVAPGELHETPDQPS